MFSYKGGSRPTLFQVYVYPYSVTKGVGGGLAGVYILIGPDI